MELWGWLGVNTLLTLLLKRQFGSGFKSSTPGDVMGKERDKTCVVGRFEVVWQFCWLALLSFSCWECCWILQQTATQSIHTLSALFCRVAVRFQRTSGAGIRQTKNSKNAVYGVPQNAEKRHPSPPNHLNCPLLTHKWPTGSARPGWSQQSLNQGQPYRRTRSLGLPVHK